MPFFFILSKLASISSKLIVRERGNPFAFFSGSGRRKGERMPKLRIAEKKGKSKSEQGLSTLVLRDEGSAKKWGRIKRRDQ
jgi:hypothetical protein